MKMLFKRILSVVLIVLILIPMFSTIKILANEETLETVFQENLSVNSSIQIGDYITLGEYYDEPISWRCVDIDENGPLMLSDKILCLKAFDANGVDSYYHIDDWGNVRKNGGSNCWSDSNLRQWLNSTEQQISWTHCSPSSEKVYVGYNPYDSEEGFLSHFTETELLYIKTVTQKSYINSMETRRDGYCDGGFKELIYYPSLSEVNYDSYYYQNVTDKIFLLNPKQIDAVYQFSQEYLLNAYPTVGAVKNSLYSNSQLSNNNIWGYWLGVPRNEGASYENQTVVNGGKISYANCYSGIYGVRPAFYLNEDVFWDHEITEYTSSSPVLSTDAQQITDELKINTEELLSSISYGNHSIKGPSITILGKTFYLFEMDSSVQIPLEHFPVELKYDVEDKTAQILIGFAEPFDEDVTLNEGDGSDSRWSDAYKKVKSLYQSVTGDKVDTTKGWTQFGTVRKDLKELKCDMLVDATCSIAGFLELSYETGEPKLSEGGIIMEASIGTEFNSVIPAFPCAYVVMGLEASLEGKIAIGYENHVTLNAELGTDLTANVGIGLGYSGKKFKTSLEGGLAGTLGFKMLAITGSFAEGVDNFEPFTVDISGEVYLKAYLLGHNIAEYDKDLFELQLYPPTNKTFASMALAGGNESLLQNATPINRDYLNNNNRLFAYESAKADDKIYSDTSVYDYNAPVLTALSDGRLLMLWVDDLGTKNDINKTSLMYSIYDGTVWSAPLEIHEIGTYNGEPVIYNDGTNVHIVWNRTKNALSDDAGLEELVEANEIYYTCFDGSDFSMPVAITDNTLFEINYSVVSSGDRVTVAWIENSDNDPISSSGTNSVYTKECIDGVWQDPVLVASYTQPVSEIAVYYNGDELCCAYTLTDADNNSDIYINSLELTQGEYMSYEDGYIYYLSDSSICKYDTVTGETISLGVDGVSNFSVSEGNLYTLVSTGFTCEMYESICNDGVYSEWKQVTEYDRYIRNYSVTTDSMGEPIYSLNLVSVDEDSDEIYGNSELAVCKAEVIESIKTTAVYYDYADVAPSAELELNVDVTNTGNVDFDKANVQVLDADGNVLSSEAVDTQLTAGESVTSKTVYTLPAELTKQDIYVKVLVSDSEREISDNTVYTTLGYGDIEVKELAVERTENGAVVKGTVSNIGYTDITNVSISVYNSSAPDEILSEISCGDIAVSEEYAFEYMIPEEYLSLENKMTMYGLTFKAITEDEESDYANNSDKVVFGELTDYTVTFVDGNEILNVLSVDEFESYIPEKAGYTFVSWHTSPFLTDGSKVTEISDDISENIMVYAKWREVPELSVDNYTVTITLADEMTAMRYASGEHTTVSSIKNAPDRVDLSASVIAKNTVDGNFVYEMPDGGYYTFWMRMSDGTEYLLAADMTKFIPTVDTYGVKITVDGLYDAKDFFIAKGEFNSYNEIKTNGYIVRVTDTKIAGKHSYTYTVSEPGMHTVLVRYNDGRENVFHEELTVDEPVFTTNGLQVTISNIPDVKVIRTAYGEYYTPGDTKRAEGARNFSNKAVIKGAEEYTLQYREEGRVTIIVEYNNGYVKVFHYDVTKKVPAMTQDGNTVTFGDLDGFVMIRYAMGEYATSSEIKKAQGSKVIKPDSIVDGKIIVTDLAVGMYTFCVQYDDESYNYYTVEIIDNSEEDSGDLDGWEDSTDIPEEWI